MSDKKRSIVVVAGKSGSGKSHLTKEYLIKQAVKKQPVIVVDSMDEYTAGQQFPDFSEFYSFVKDSGFKSALYVIKVKTDADARRCFAFSASCQVKHCIVVEEASKYCSPHKVDEYLYSITAYGRHYAVSGIFITQRLAQINKMITSQADILLSFSQTEAVDVAAAKNYSDYFSLLRSLKKREFLALANVGESLEFSVDSIHIVDGNKIKKSKISS